MRDDAEVPAELIDGNENDTRVIGDDRFLDQVDDAVLPSRGQRTLSELIGDFCERYQVTEAELASPARTRRNCDIRARIAATAQWEHVATLHEVALRFHRSDNAISRSVIRLRQNDPDIPR